MLPILADVRDAAVPESRSPGLHHTTVPNPIGMGQSMYMQMKPLDLGVAERNRIIHDSHSGGNHVGMLQSPYADIKTKPSTSPRPLPYDNRDQSLNLAPKMRRTSTHAVDRPFERAHVPRIITTPDVTIVESDARPIEPIERYSVLSMNAKKLAHRLADPKDVPDKHPKHSNSYGSGEDRLAHDSRQAGVNNSSAAVNNKNHDVLNRHTNDVDSNSSNHNSNETMDNEDNNNNHSNNVAKNDGSRLNANEAKAIDNGANRANSQSGDERSSKGSSEDGNAKELHDNLGILGASSATLRTNSADGLLRSSSSSSSPAPSPCSAQSAPATPAKLPTDCDKPTSPGMLSAVSLTLYTTHGCVLTKNPKIFSVIREQRRPDT